MHMLYIDPKCERLEIRMRPGEIKLKFHYPQTNGTTNMNDKFEHAEIQTLPQVQDQETQMMQNLFQRAADTIVNASKLGKEVNELREEMKKLLADTERMREHISWLEQENQTLRSQRDEAQNTLSDTKAELDRWVRQHNNIEFINNNLTKNLENARNDAKTWETLANETEKSLNEAKTLIANLEDMLHRVWHGVKDHFAPKPQPPQPEPEIAPRVEPQTGITQYTDATQNEAPKAEVVPNAPPSYWNNPNQHPAE